MTHDLSIGFWGLQHTGADPFGGPVRGKLPLDDGLEMCATAGIGRVSFHDLDCWPVGTPLERRLEIVEEVCLACGRNGVIPYNWTANTFSFAGYRGGAGSNPNLEVRLLACQQGLEAMDLANAFGAANVIKWGGREGDDGAHAVNAGLGMQRYLEWVLLCLIHAQRQGYTFGVTIEPKQYEPRLLELYPSSAAAVLSGLAWLKTRYPQYADLIDTVRINPEYPQHTQMRCMSAVMECEKLLHDDKLAPFIHFGGQHPGSLDCDLGPFWGSNDLNNLLLFVALARAGWRGVVEYDCRPLRTTITQAGVQHFLDESVAYTRRIEELAEAVACDSIAAELYDELNNEFDEPEAIQELRSGSDPLTEGSLAEINEATLETAAVADTDRFERYAARVKRVMLGY